MSTLANGLFSVRERLAMVAGSAGLVVLAAALAFGAELDERERAFRMEAHNISLHLSRLLAEGRTMMVALHGLHGASDDLRGARFPHIARSFTDTHPQVRWMAYAEHVPSGGERAFEARMEEAGFIALKLHPLRRHAEADRETPAGSGDRLAVSMLEPLTPRLARLLGADLLGHAPWRDRLLAAVEQAGVVALRTAETDLGAEGFLLVRATFRGNVEPGDAAGRRRQVAGLLMLFLDASTLVGEVATAHPRFQIALRGPGEAPAPTNREEVHISRLGGGPGFQASRLSVDVDLELAGARVPFRLSAALAPDPTAPLAAGALALLFAASVIHALRQRRIALREERASFEQAQLAEVTLHSIGEAVLRLDDHGLVRYLNPVAEVMTGVDAARAEGRPLHQVLRLRGAAGECIDGAALVLPGVLAAPVTVEMADGTGHAVACTLSRLEDSRGGDSGHVLVVRDVSREQELSRELAYQATHDPLTDLPNRREFERRLAAAVEDARDGDHAHVLLYLDLDQFKVVNDTCGHAAGDEMLRQVAGLLAAEVREGDVLARLGGDEFGVLLHDCDIERATPLADRLCQVVASFRFTWGESAFGLGASIGVVAVERAAGTVDDLQRAADLACYAAKDTGRNRIHVYRRGDRVISRNHDEMQWQLEIKNALEQDRFVLHAQEIRRLHDVASPPQMFEMLLRMTDPDGRLVPPMAFLPAAERYGLMAELDRMVVQHALGHVARSPHVEAVYTINLSGQSLADPGLGDFIMEAARRAGISPQRVCFEITETSAISNLNQAAQLMSRLRRAGFRFALDDFGAGLSSFGYLKQLPVDFLKIDGQFIRDIESDPVARAMVSSIINVARVLRLQTIAEKVENPSAQHCLRILGADYAQGWLIGRPQPLDEPEQMLATSA